LFRFDEIIIENHLYTSLAEYNISKEIFEDIHLNQEIEKLDI